MSFQIDFGRHAKSFVHVHVPRIPLGPTSLHRQTAAGVQLSVRHELGFAAKSSKAKSGNCQGSLAASLWHSCCASPPFLPLSHPSSPTPIRISPAAIASLHWALKSLADQV